MNPRSNSATNSVNRHGSTAHMIAARPQAPARHQKGQTAAVHDPTFRIIDLKVPTHHLNE